MRVRVVTNRHIQACAIVLNFDKNKKKMSTTPQNNVNVRRNSENDTAKFKHITFCGDLLTKKSHNKKKPN